MDFQKVIQSTIQDTSHSHKSTKLLAAILHTKRAALKHHFSIKYADKDTVYTKSATNNITNKNEDFTSGVSYHSKLTNNKSITN